MTFSQKVMLTRSPPGRAASPMRAGLAKWAAAGRADPPTPFGTGSEAAPGGAKGRAPPAVPSWSLGH